MSAVCVPMPGVEKHCRLHSAGLSCQLVPCVPACRKCAISPGYVVTPSLLSSELADPDQLFEKPSRQEKPEMDVVNSAASREDAICSRREYSTQGIRVMICSLQATHRHKKVL